MEQLVQCVRPGVLLDAASLPCLHTTDRHGRLLPLNRYILDYWGHNQKQALVTANGMREGAQFSPAFTNLQSYAFSVYWLLMHRALLAAQPPVSRSRLVMLA